MSIVVHYLNYLLDAWVLRLPREDGCTIIYARDSKYQFHIATVLKYLPSYSEKSDLWPSNEERKCYYCMSGIVMMLLRWPESTILYLANHHLMCQWGNGPTERLYPMINLCQHLNSSRISWVFSTCYISSSEKLTAEEKKVDNEERQWQQSH